MTLGVAVAVVGVDARAMRAWGFALLLAGGAAPALDEPVTMTVFLLPDI